MDKISSPFATTGEPLYRQQQLFALLRQRRFRRLLVLGHGSDPKTQLLADLAGQLATDNGRCSCLSTNLGLPPFGPPGAVALAGFADGHWQSPRLAAICSLDAGRFRQPLVTAVHQLNQAHDDAPLLVDVPTLSGGIAASELLTGLMAGLDIDAIIILSGTELHNTLANEFLAWGSPCYTLAMEPAALPRRRHRQALRQQRWQDYLRAGKTLEWMLDQSPCLGAPPPRDAPQAWLGRQVALLRRGETKAMGQILAMDGACLTLNIAGSPHQADQLLIRDAWIGDNGELQTAPRLQQRGNIPGNPKAKAPIQPVSHKTSRAPVRQAAPPVPHPAPTVQLGRLVATLCNGTFGDPLLHVALLNKRRSLLFDLGETSRLSIKSSHQVSDIFISHGHMDHLFGFTKLLRTRMGITQRCRLFGPPGLAALLHGQLNGYLWDRIGDHGPTFDIHEYDGQRLNRFRLRAGCDKVEYLGGINPPDNVILADQHCKVRAQRLDHGTPVLAYSLETPSLKQVNRQQLAKSDLTAGPWLGELLHHLAHHRLSYTLQLPNGQQQSVAALARQLIVEEPGKKLVYATDLAVHRQNHQALVAFAQGADLLFCEANFRNHDLPRALANGHLTTRTCAAIARDAGVGALAPFHFSNRYEGQRDAVYAELRQEFHHVLPPGNRLIKLS